MREIAKQIHRELMNARKIIIVPHQYPDGDALGSVGAMREYLISLGKEVLVYCATAVSPKWEFIPHSKAVTSDPGHFDDLEVDIVLVMDTGDLRRAGLAEYLAGRPATIINIDHHVTNEKFGHINLVIPNASSTAEIIYYFLRHNQIRINRMMATALLAGIITDTDNFTNGATTTSSLFVAGDLLRLGGNLSLINRYTVKDKSMASLKLWGIALSRLTRDEAHDITYTFLTQNDFSECAAAEAETEGIASFLNNLSGTKVSLILKETADGQVKGSLRTTRDDADVAALALRLGGGGHKKAAGFTIPGDIDRALAEILTKV